MNLITYSGIYFIKSNTAILEHFYMLSFFQGINKILWGTPLLAILMGTHLFFTFHLKFIQKKTFHAIRLSVTPENGQKKGFSSFGALATTLAATLGTGNIVGISTAIALGGPGAVFWCWITGILGMATSYAECCLSMIYRQKGANGESYGGPMYVLEHGLKKKGLAVFYALCVLAASFGVGCTTQSNAMADTLYYLWKVSPYTTGMLSAVLVGFVLIGGLRSMEKLCVKLVPAMGGLYFIGCFCILAINFQFIGDSLLLIFRSAFSISSITGGICGGMLSFTIKQAARYGIARGLFTNEAGLGSAAIAAAASDTKNPQRQALISMTAAFWDTVVMCAVTGLVIITNLLHNPASIRGKSLGGLTHAAFEILPMGEYILGLCLILFAFATLVGWSYFGQQAYLYLFPEKHIKIYQIIYLVMIFMGAVMSLDLVWEMTDTINVLMAVPNLIALYGLRKMITVPK